MKVDIGLGITVQADVESIQAAEATGYDVAWLPETNHDPLLTIAAAAPATERIGLGTSILVAFARSPMTTAVAANDLQLYSGGRFLLGLGSQVKAHITGRFSMPWSDPAKRMTEYIAAVRAIWTAWATGEQLDFQGDYYTHTVMTPIFDPGPNPHGNPPILLAGVGPQMTRVAGEIADGFMVHGFTTERYFREVTLPGLMEGRAAAGRSMDGYEVSGFPFIVTGLTEEAMAEATRVARKQLAFYASTPAYRTVLELHGWGDAGVELTTLSKQGEWDAMGHLIDDQMLDAFAVVAEPDQVAEKLLARYGDLFTRLTPYPLGKQPAELWEPIIRKLQAA
jgi:probable F420-dependent oxidoreductase